MGKVFYVWYITGVVGIKCLVVNIFVFSDSSVVVIIFVVDENKTDVLSFKLSVVDKDFDVIVPISVVSFTEVDVLVFPVVDFVILFGFSDDNNTVVNARCKAVALTAKWCVVDTDCDDVPPIYVDNVEINCITVFVASFFVEDISEDDISIVVSKVWVVVLIFSVDLPIVVCDVFIDVDIVNNGYDDVDFSIEYCVVVTFSFKVVTG